MELMFDNANIDTIKEFAEIYPFVGVTSNPTIIKKEGKIDFFNHFRKLREVIGADKSLHIQVVSQTAEEMIKEAEKIVENIDKDVYIKIPVTEEGLKAIKNLKSRGFRVTATAIYTKMQGLVAIAAGADYIAPYFNRIQSRGSDAAATVACFRQNIDFFGKKTKILAASFHHGGQVIKALQAGADAVTLSPDLLREMICINPTNYIENAITTFAADWEESQGTKSILDCE
ncbi:MAG: fructose-6-phosphate aldolase [Clostridia bacterium]|nr:fructose-6-phosphate aldolase [Clostridia bacterium]